MGLACQGILLDAVPYLRTRFVAYGARSHVKEDEPKADGNVGSSSPFPLNLVETALGYQLPHWYFVHFYVLSLALSMFWAFQMWTKGSILQHVAALPDDAKQSPAMSREQVLLLWSLMALQGYRRLHESILYMKPSASRMPLSIYLIGMAYYLTVSMAVWIEGSSSWPVHSIWTNADTFG